MMWYGAILILLALAAGGAPPAEAEQRRGSASRATVSGQFGNVRFSLGHQSFRHRGVSRGFAAPVVICPPAFAPIYSYPPPYFTSGFHSRYGGGYTPPSALTYSQFGGTYRPPGAGPVYYPGVQLPWPGAPVARAAPTAPASGLEQIRAQLEVQREESGLYSVRWRSPRSDMLSVEYEVQDAERRLQSAQRLTGAPFETPLEVPEAAAFVIVTVAWEDGSSAALRVPAEEFRRLGVGEGDAHLSVTGEPAH